MNQDIWCKLCFQSSDEDDEIKLLDQSLNEDLQEIVHELFKGQIIITKDDWVCYCCEELLQGFYEFYHQVLENYKIDEPKKLKQVVNANMDLDLINIDKHVFEREVVEECCPELIYYGGQGQSPVELGNSETLPKQMENSLSVASEGNENKSVLLGSQVLMKPIKTTSKTRCRPGARWKKSDECVAVINKVFEMKCDLCNDTPLFPTYYDLIQHMKKSHRESQKVWTCCGRRLTKRHHLVKHANEHLNPYICKYCGIQEFSRKSFRRHIHCGPSRKFQCNHCDKLFRAKCHLKRHLLLTHFRDNTVAQEFVCELCARGFSKKAALENHQTYDHSAEPIKEPCSICGALVLMKNKGMKLHLKTFHENEGKKWPCTECGEIFNREKSMVKHRTWKHRRGRSHVCPDCGKGFFTPTHLKEHMAIHNGALLYKCLNCGVGFKNSGNYYAHIRRLHPSDFKEMQQQSRNKRSNFIT